MTIASDKVEIWAGHECSIARIGNEFRSVGTETGHDSRLEDLRQAAALGVRTVRYPVLWEKVAPVHPDECDWTWVDARLSELRRLELSPVVGLLHHGSGPRYTHLLDPRFGDLFAGYASRVASRHPWVKRFTPVNEPLTTARFSCLYGHWYPHEKSNPAFLRALINECRGSVLAMRAIRRSIPDAELVQTEDLGKIFSTPKLAYQAAFENERRWLSFDLLCGRVNCAHPFWEIFLANRVEQRELEFFLEQPCPPDILGIDHYLTSDRFLDEDLALYPTEFHGGNKRDSYADVEAVRCDLPEDATGPKARLLEAWERYRLPIAVTEAHHGCSRDEQLRWFMEVWRAANELRNEGVDIRAVTNWALFGSMDWSSLLIEKRGHYEPGAFDSRSDPPRRTAVGRAVAALAAGDAFDHPVLDGDGWWRGESRFYQPPRGPRPVRAQRPRRKLLITGGNGMLARAISRMCRMRGLEHISLSRASMDIADEQSIARVVDDIRPWAVINAAGYVRFGDADRQLCMRENAFGPALLSAACAERGVQFVTFSSDLVFDGRLGRAYVEDDRPSPHCAYGQSKFEAERRVGVVFPSALIIRSSAFFCPSDRTNFAYRSLQRLEEGARVEASANEWVAPTYVPDLAHATLDLLIDGEAGIWHLANAGELSWHAFALRLAEGANFRRHLVRPVMRQQRNTALASARGRLLPPLDDAIERFFRDSPHRWRGRTAVGMSAIG